MSSPPPPQSTKTAAAAATTTTTMTSTNSKASSSSSSSSQAQVKEKIPESYKEALKRMLKLVNSLLSRNDCGPFREPVDWRGLELYDYPKIIKKMMDLGTVKRKIERKIYRKPQEVASDIRLVWSNCATYNMEGSDFWLLAKSFSKRFEDRYKKIKNEFNLSEDDEDEDDEEAEFEINNEQQKGGGGSTMVQVDSNAKDSSHHRRSSPKGGSEYDSSGKSSGKVSESNKKLPPNDASLDIKVHLASNIFLLSGMELGHVISKIELKCPQALEHDTDTTTADDKKKDTTTTTNNFLKSEHCEINIDKLDNKTLNELDRYVREKVGTRHSSLGINATNIPPPPMSSSGNSGGGGGGSAEYTSSTNTRPNKKRRK